jgi:hypothetical protein
MRMPFLPVCRKNSTVPALKPEFDRAECRKRKGPVAEAQSIGTRILSWARACTRRQEREEERQKILDELVAISGSIDLLRFLAEEQTKNERRIGLIRCVLTDTLANNYCEQANGRPTKSLHRSRKCANRNQGTGWGVAGWGGDRDRAFAGQRWSILAKSPPLFQMNFREQVKAPHSDFLRERSRLVDKPLDHW